MFVEIELINKYRNQHKFRVTLDWSAMIAEGKPTNFGQFKESVDKADNGQHEIIPINSDNLQSVIDYDTNITKIDRSQWCRWFLLTHPTAVAYHARDRATNRVVGYGCVRMIREKVLKIEPLNADSECIARMLLTRLLSSFETIAERRVSVFYRSSDQRMVNLVKELGLMSPFSVQFMYTEHAIDCDYDKIYALSAFQLSIGY